MRDYAFFNKPSLPAAQGVGLLQVQQFLSRPVKFLIIGTGVTRQAFHLDPEKERSAAAANFFEGFIRRIVNLLDVLSFDLAPVVLLENVQRERIRFPRRHADAVGVVFHKKEHGKFLFFREADGLEKISLTRCGVTYCRDDDIFLSIKLNAPGDAARRKKL